MDAKSELTSALLAAFPGLEEARLAEVLAPYQVGREDAGGRSNLRRRIRQFLTAKRIDGLSEKTLKNYSYDLAIFEGQVKKHIAKINTDDIREYIAYLYDERGNADSSVQTKINTLRSFFSWSRDEGIVKRNPMSKIKSMKLDKKHARKPLTSEEVERMRDACRTYREKAMLEFFVSSGVRLDEAATIEVDSLNLQDRSVTVHGKGDKSRTVYFSVRARLMIELYLKDRRGAAPSLPAAGGPTAPSSTGPSSGSSRASASGRGSTTGSTPTCCATPLPPRPTTRGWTCPSSSGFWATRSWTPRRSTPRSAWSTYGGSTTSSWPPDRGGAEGRPLLLFRGRRGPASGLKRGGRGECTPL
ncbi:tyrosine-type recombinase/integrase [Bittarella sp. HCP28S3_D9]|uniref:tyrosine-type recombinase/integrase n=1 Tax=Bittarella sp. HCP28S3_D9 TaxID=3440253 RepID=UPI003F89642C